MLIKLISTLFLSLMIITFSACCDATKEKSTEVEVVDTKNLVKTVINVEGMTCEGCESAIQMNLSKIPGVVSVKASHTEKNTVIEYDKSQVSVTG